MPKIIKGAIRWPEGGRTRSHSRIDIRARGSQRVSLAPLKGEHVVTYDKLRIFNIFTIALASVNVFD